MNPFLPKPTHSPADFADFNAGTTRARRAYATDERTTRTVKCRRDCGRRTETKSGVCRACQREETP